MARALEEGEVGVLRPRRRGLEGILSDAGGWGCPLRVSQELHPLSPEHSTPAGGGTLYEGAREILAPTLRGRHCCVPISQNGEIEAKSQ